MVTKRLRCSSKIRCVCMEKQNVNYPIVDRVRSRVSIIMCLSALKTGKSIIRGRTIQVLLTNRDAQTLIPGYKKKATKKKRDRTKRRYKSYTLLFLCPFPLLGFFCLSRIFPIVGVSGIFNPGPDLGVFFLHHDDHRRRPIIRPIISLCDQRI